MAFRDKLERIKNDVTQELQQPNRQQDIQRVKQGFKEALAGAKSLGEGVIDRTRSGESVAVVVEDDDTQTAAPTQPATPSAPGVRLAWNALWNRGFGEEPSVVSESQWQHAIAVSSVTIYDGDVEVATLKSDTPVRATADTFTSLRKDLGQVAWQYDGFGDDRAATVGTLMAACAPERLLTDATWEFVDSLPHGTGSFTQTT